MAPKKKLTGKKRKKRDPDAPKAPPTAYVLFCKDNRAKVLESYPNADFAESNKRLGESWKNASVEDRNEYTTRAAKLRYEYQRVLAKYNAEHPKGDSDDESPKKRRKRAKKDPDAPKKPTSAYFYFQKKIRAQVKEELGEKSAVGDIAKRIAERWRELTPEGKEPYNQLAEEDRERYKKEKAAFDKKPKPKPTKSKKKAASESESSDSSDSDSDGSDDSGSGSGSESSDDESDSD